MMSSVPSVDPLRFLVDGARAGDDASLAELVRRTQPAVWRLCEVLGRPEDPADLAQETYARMVRSLPAFRAEAPVEAWVLSIARRVCADAVRKRQRQRRLLDRIARHTPVAWADPVLWDDSLGALVALLHPDRREAFVLTQELGLSYEEAAAVIGCPIGTIRSRVARARAELLDAVRRAADTA
jgi:RNA polymerase sigma-70 factor (ECF subfamily)